MIGKVKITVFIKDHCRINPFINSTKPINKIPPPYGRGARLAIKTINSKPTPGNTNRNLGIPDDAGI